MNTDVDEKIGTEATPPDAKCPNTPDMFEGEKFIHRVLYGSIMGAPLSDKCISDDFPKQIDQREED